MVTLTFFLWEITSKFFFLAWGFGLLAMRRNYFENRGRGILVNSAIFSLFLRYLTNFTYILTVLTQTQNMVNLILIGGTVNPLI